MTASPNEVTALRSEQDVVIARQVVRRIAQALGFSLVDQTKIVTATSELARNTVKHGLGGMRNCKNENSGARTGVRLTFTDEGPGIPDINRALTDGFTTGGGLGMGLSGAKRLVNEFELDSKVGGGTRVTIIRWK